MEIGEVIRRYRKEKQLTQEEMAGYLGVTAPAVNKWENGNSYPDIALLAPIARLLNISTDTLLSYRGELTEKEIGQFLLCIKDKVEQEGYEEAFRWAEDRIREYPDSIRLAFLSAQTLDGYRIIYGVEDMGGYGDKIHDWYVRALESRDYDILQLAAIALFQYHLSKKEYEKAQEYLDRIPKRVLNPKQLQANLYASQEKFEEAYPLYEQILFAGFSELNGALNGILGLALKEKDEAKAEKIAGIQKELARLLEMGKYMEALPGLELAIHAGNKEAALEKLEGIASCVWDMDSFRKSELYSHIAFNDSGKKNIVRMLQKSLESDESLEFMREDERFGRILEELKRHS